MSQFIKEDPIFIEIVLNSLHVDDVNAGTSRLRDLILIKDGFNLQKICSNSHERKQTVTNELQEDISNENYILGLHNGTNLMIKLFLMYQNIVKKIPEVFTSFRSINVAESHQYFMI